MAYAPLGHLTLSIETIINLDCFLCFDWMSLRGNQGSLWSHQPCMLQVYHTHTARISVSSAVPEPGNGTQVRVVSLIIPKAITDRILDTTPVFCVELNRN